MTYLKEIIIHEIGHWVIGNKYGLEGEIYKQDEDHYFYSANESLGTDRDGPEKRLTLAMGGLAANEICGHENKAQYLGDVLQSFNEMKRYQEMNNKDFPYARPGHVPLELYKPFLERAKTIIQEYGGEQYLEAVFEHLTKK